MRFLVALLLAVTATAGVVPVAQADDYFTSITVKNRTFYPKVADSFRDTVSIEWSNSPKNAEWGSYTVVDADGVTVLDLDTTVPREEAADAYADYDIGWAMWDGRTGTGKPVPTGTYTMKVTVEDTDGGTHSFSRTVVVATGTRWFKRSLSFRGSSFDVKKTRGNCTVTRARSVGEAWLDCWHGNFAKVRYSYYLDYDLRLKDLTWSVTGDRRCCAPGDVVKRSIRDHHNVDIVVKTTGWRRYDVWRVHFAYYAKNRI